ncbi:MAG: DUF885 family protein [Elusimicrobiota bacterium]
MPTIAAPRIAAKLFPLIAALLPLPVHAVVVEFAPIRAAFVSQLVAFRPEAATRLGMPGFNNQISIPTPENIAKQIGFFETIQQQLATAHGKDAQEEIDRQVMLTVARSQLHELKDKRSYREEVGAAQGPYDIIQVQTAQMGANPADEWKNIVERAELVPEYLKAVQRNLAEGAQEGRQVYRGFVQKDGIKGAESAADYFGTELIAKAKEQLTPSDFDALKQRLEKAGKSAQDAYLRHAEFLKEKILPQATEKYGIGREEYVWKLKNELGLKESPEELQKKGQEIAARITVRMQELAKEINTDKPLPELMAELKADHPKNDEELLAKYSEVKSLARSNEGLLAIHSAEVPTVRRLLDHAGYAASLNIEGYAHYAEQLMRARGFDTKKEELTQLGAQLWRAWRISLDAALHTGAVTLEEAARILTEKAFLPEAISKDEPYRYAKMPTQALTSLLGRLQIEELKAAYQRKTGSGYNEAEFHKEFLSYGPALPRHIGPAMLEAARPGSWIKRAWQNPVVTVLAAVATAAAFNGGVYVWMGAQSAQEFLSIYLIEWTLSLDNLVVLSTVLHALPREIRPQVLGWGILGAVGMRLSMVSVGMGVAAASPWVFVVFGAFLLLVALKMLKPEWDLVGGLTARVKAAFKPREARAAKGWFANPFFAGLLAVIGYDAIFALDSVPAALAISSSVFIIISANVLSVLGLRSLFQVLNELEERFPHLQKGVAAVHFFVAVKLMLGPLFGLHVGSLASLLIVLAALVGSMLIPARRPSSE